MFGTSGVARRHWPMHGPAGVRQCTDAPIPSSACICPSRSIVARICSDPGVTSSRAAVEQPVPLHLRRRDIGGRAAHVLVGGVGAATDVSAVDIVSTDPLAGSAISAARREIGRARSGLCGPTTCGSSIDRSSAITRS